MVDAMCAPSTHNAPGQLLLAVLRIVFQTFSTTVCHFSMTLVSESWVLGAIAYLWHAVTAPHLKNISYYPLCNTMI